MNQLSFPPEISLFKSRLTSSTLDLLESTLSELPVSFEEIKLKDWYNCLLDISRQQQIDNPDFWALVAKLAWILADLDFFTNQITLLENYKDAPLLSFYFGAGLSEFIDFDKGFGLLEKGFADIKKKKDFEALKDLVTPYALIFNNSDNHEKLKSQYSKICELLEISPDKNIENYPWFIPFHLFSMKKERDSDPEKNQSILSSVIKTGNNLNSALTYNLLSKMKNKNKYPENIKSSIMHLEKIDARYRLIIAYTNYGNYIGGSESNLDEAQKYYEKAMSISSDLALDQDQPSPLTVYPLSQKAHLQIECGELDKAKKTYLELKKAATSANNIMYQSQAEFGLGHLAFLQLDNESAWNHANKGLSIVSTSSNYNLKCLYELKYTDQLIELNKLEEAKEMIDSLSEKEFESCSAVFYKYIKSKFELYSHNLGTAKILLQEALSESDICPSIRPSIIFALTEGYLYEYRITEDMICLEIAQETLENGLKDIKDIPRKAKGKWLNAVLLIAQGKIYEAEDMLLELISVKQGTVPRIFKLAEDLLDDIRQRRIERIDISPISNIKDVVRYLRDVKSFVELDSQ